MTVLYVLTAHFQNIARSLPRYVTKLKKSGQYGIRTIDDLAKFLMRHVPFPMRHFTSNSDARIGSIRQTLTAREVEYCRQEGLLPRRGYRLPSRAHVLPDMRRRNVVERHVAECYTQCIELPVIFLASLGSFPRELFCPIKLNCIGERARCRAARFQFGVTMQCYAFVGAKGNVVTAPVIATAPEIHTDREI